MKLSLLYVTVLLGLLLSACSPDGVGNDTIIDTGKSPNIAMELKINAASSVVWNVLTNPNYAKILGNEFDKGAFLESEWKLGSDVHFKYEPDSLISTGTISELVENQLIVISYDFDGYLFSDSYTIETVGDAALLKIASGPYGPDYPDHIPVWKNWLRKVKEMSEAE